MIYTNHYASPLGRLLLAGDEEDLTGLWFMEIATITPRAAKGRCGKGNGIF